jgi:hypothetical protein
MMSEPIDEYKIHDYTEARDEVQSRVVPPEQPTPTNLSRGWIIGSTGGSGGGAIDVVSGIYSYECEVDSKISSWAIQHPDVTFMKMEISAYVKAKVEAVWS